METIGMSIKASMIRQTKIQNQLFKSRPTENEKMKSFISTKSQKLNFDHLALRDQAHKAYKKINQILEKYEKKTYSKMVFSDYLYKYNVELQKTRVIMLITDNSLFLLSMNNY